MSERGCVYLLIDPRNNAVRYVGASKNPERRYNQHRTDWCHKEICDWFDELEKQDMMPKMAIVGCEELEQLDVLEEKWIRMMNSNYDLFNRNTNITYNSKKVKNCV